jgi:hypothetical protein
MRTIAPLILSCVLALVAEATAEEVRPPLKALLAIGKEGDGNPQAAAAWKQLVQTGPLAIPDLLAAFDDTKPVANNWLRTACDAIGERELQAGRPLAAEPFEKFVKDTHHSAVGRRIAYEWLVRLDPKAPARLLPTMLDDPSAELRRDAVNVLIEDGKRLVDQANKDDAKALLLKAFAASRDRDQVDAIADQLKKLGTEVDLVAHLGVIQRWLIATSFDNVGGGGFATAYPPEKVVDLNAVLKGKGNAEVRWKEYATTDPYGLLDLNKEIGKEKGVVTYAFAAVESPKEQAIEIRAGSNNAIKLFLNGKELFFREEYHHGIHFDQHVGVGTLRAGRNEILVKICQNEQTENWAQSWSFQVRVCDAIGGAVPLKFLPEKPKVGEKGQP